MTLYEKQGIFNFYVPYSYKPSDHVRTTTTKPEKRKHGPRMPLTNHSLRGPFVIRPPVNLQYHIRTD